MNRNNFYKFHRSREQLNHVAFPLGGIGAGMLCLEGTGALSNVSLRHAPDVFNQPMIFSALTIKNQASKNLSLVLEGPVQKRKIFGAPDCALGYCSSANYGLPRFENCDFNWAFPFAQVLLSSEDCPLKVEISGWSPFIPGESDNSSLPVAGLEFSFENLTDKTVEAIYSYNCRNFLSVTDGKSHVKKNQDGFTLIEQGSSEEPWKESYFEVACSESNTKINPSWFRGAWFDPLTMVWKDIDSGMCPCLPEISTGDASPGATLYVPFKLAPGEKKTVTIRLSWYTPHSNLRVGAEPESDVAESCSKKESEKKSLQTYSPWYSSEFKNIKAVSDYWQNNYRSLKGKTMQFCESLHATTLPGTLMEAVDTNLSILKSPTVLRQNDGRLWGWEGCRDNAGSCAGSCTHVWNYAQALPHLFPDLERSLRQTEFNENQAKNGHQNFRASLPIRPVNHTIHAASDGQLGGIMKVYREWRICGDTKWLKSLWPKVKTSLDYCIETWDPDHLGVLVEPHHNTYDIEFWGPDGMCSSFYLGALKAAALMTEAIYEVSDLYSELYTKGRKYLEAELFNGEYFIQKIQWKNSRAGSPVSMREYSGEAKALLEKEGPKYQYGNGCLSDGVLGAWMAEVCGVGEILDPKKVKSHLLAVYKYNLKCDLNRHVTTQRPGYAIGHEGGLLLCTWPHGGELSLPFVYSNEVWTGIEYQVASHLMMFGCINEAMEIVETLRKRYDGSVRNPFNEYECGHWYARAMSSYSLLQGITGIRYDAVEKVLYMAPQVKDDFESFICTSTGYGIAGIKDGKPFLKVIDGEIEAKEIICK
jgi:uncharacterized protein (DUF608 family)